MGGNSPLESFALYSYEATTFASFLLLLFSILRVNENPLSIPVIIALTFSIVWSCYIINSIENSEFYIHDTLPAESLRNLAWFYFISVLISKQQFNNQTFLLTHSWQVPFFLLLTGCIVILESSSELRYQFQQLIGFDFRLVIHIGFAIVGLMLVEQLYRNALQEQRWAIKFMCLGLA